MPALSNKQFPDYLNVIPTYIAGQVHTYVCVCVGKHVPFVLLPSAAERNERVDDEQQT